MGRLGRVAARALIAAMMLLVLIASTALADTSTLEDPDDTVGKLDIAAVSVGHYTSPAGVRKLTYTFTTHGGWSVKGFGKMSKLLVHMEPSGGEANDRKLEIVRKDVGLVAKIFKGRRVRIWRKVLAPRFDYRTVRVAFPRRLLGTGTTEYLWRASSRFLREDYNGCDTFYCVDAVPDTGTAGPHVIGP